MFEDYQFDIDTQRTPDFINSLNKPIDKQNTIHQCNQCNIHMTKYADHYKCPCCDSTIKISKIVQESNEKSNVSNSIRINNGKDKGRYYSVNVDYSKTQYKAIIDQLVQNQNEYMSHNDTIFSTEVLVSAAQKYNKIQKYVTDTVIDKDGMEKQKKFVHRGDIKNEVLAALIYYSFIEIGITRKKRDVANFMKLPTDGFSRGENLIRDIQAAGKISLTLDMEPTEGFVERYFETLNINNDKYSKFVLEMVNRSEDINLAMNRHISSKVVGTMWFLIEMEELGIKSEQLSKAADGIKKNTFGKFYSLIIKHRDVFEDIIEKYNIGK